MKKQSLKDKLDESLGMRRGKESTKKQSMKDRRDESIGAEGMHPMALAHHKAQKMMKKAVKKIRSKKK